jgi:predicted dehydrogenase
MSAEPSVVTIGAGYFAALHVDSWMRNSAARLVGLVDLDASKARALAEVAAGSGAGPEVSDDAAELLTRLRPDIVDIVTPPAAHFAVIESALRHRPKAIICQKPFCASLDEARRAVDLAEAAGVPLIVHENFRFQPWYRILRAEIDAGRLGELYQITFRLRPGDGQGASAYLDRQPYFQRMERFLVHETAVHWIDTFRFLMGEPEAVIADLRQLNPAISGEDAGLILFAYPQGRRAVFDGNRLADHAAQNPRLTMGECIAEGSRGTITLDGFGTLGFRAFGAQETVVIGGEYPRDRFGGDCVHALQCHVSDHLLHGTPLENVARDYLQVIRTELAIYEAAASGSRVWIDGGPR